LHALWLVHVFKQRIQFKMYFPAHEILFSATAQRQGQPFRVFTATKVGIAIASFIRWAL